MATFHVDGPTATFAPIQFTEEERGEIDQKIKELVKNKSSQTVFFEYRTTDSKFYFIHYGGEQISFTAEEVKSESAEEAVKNLFSQAFSKTKHLLTPLDITIIDAVYHRIRTTSIQVNDKRIFHPKVPGKTECLLGRIGGSTICEQFIRDTFDNLRGTRQNW